MIVRKSLRKDNELLRDVIRNLRDCINSKEEVGNKEIAEPKEINQNELIGYIASRFSENMREIKISDILRVLEYQDEFLEDKGIIE